MKKIAFLFGLIVLLSGARELSALDRHIETGREEIEGVNTLVVSVRGRDVFDLPLGKEDLRYSAEGTKIVDDAYLVYGSVLDQREGRRAYDAFFMVADSTGEVVLHEVFDLGHHEKVSAVYRLGDGYAALVGQTFDLVDGVLHHVAYFTDNELKEIFCTEMEIRNLERHGDVLYMSETNSGYFENALLPEGRFLEPGEIYDLAHQGEYETGVMFHSLSMYEIEGESVRNAHVVDYPGHYTFSRTGQIRAFTVHPGIEGVESQGVYHEPIAVHVDAGHLFLNDDAYKNGELIVEVGHHKLRVEGLNGYEKTVNFTLSSGFEDLENYGVYDEPITLDFRGDGKLNGTAIASGTILEDSGDYSLVITGVNDYQETHHFTLDIEEPDSRAAFVRLEIAVVGVLLATLGIVVVKAWKKP